MEDHAGGIVYVDKMYVKKYLVNFRELNPGAEQLVIRLTGTCRLPRKTGRRGKREPWRW